MKYAVSVLLLLGCIAKAEAVAVSKSPEIACYVTGYQYNSVKKLSNNTQKEDQYFDNVRFPLYEGTLANCKTLSKQFSLDHTGLRINVDFASPCTSQSTIVTPGFMVQMTDGAYNYLTAYPVSPTTTQLQTYFVSCGKTFDLQIYCIQD